MILWFIMRYTKALMIAVMLGTMAGVVNLFIVGFDKHVEGKDATVYWFFSALCLVICVCSFLYACKLGKNEDAKNREEYAKRKIEQDNKLSQMEQITPIGINDKYK